jgi:oxidase EvaA
MNIQTAVRQAKAARPSSPKARDGRLRRELGRILHAEDGEACLDFLLSAMTERNPFHTTEEIEGWLRSLNQQQYLHVTPIPFAELRGWKVDPATGNLRHETGGFFSIRGLRVRTTGGETWTQPIIDQPEIGMLGIVAKRFGGILHFLMQAKAEPGNINTFQLSPTCQATRSNFRRLHQGKKTLYLEFFTQPGRAEVLVDQLQSEQGARFYHKRNRNMVVRLRDDEEIAASPNHRWMTLGQIHRLMQRDNTINMDTRSVLSCISFCPSSRFRSTAAVSVERLRTCLEASSFPDRVPRPEWVDLLVSGHPLAPSRLSTGQILHRMCSRKFVSEFQSNLIPLREIEGWETTDYEIRHGLERFFTVLAVRVEAANREVGSWDQPIIRQNRPGLVGLLGKKLDGVLHFLFQTSTESGIMDLLELAPTVQCTTETGGSGSAFGHAEWFQKPQASTVLCDVWQSEEGGRFYRETNRNIAVLIPEAAPVPEAGDALWITLSQVKQLLAFSNQFNVEARSVLACLERY